MLMYHEIIFYTTICKLYVRRSFILIYCKSITEYKGLVSTIITIILYNMLNTTRTCRKVY